MSPTTAAARETVTAITAMTTAMTATTSSTEQDADAMLEKMLLEAERLAAKMRSASSSIGSSSKASTKSKSSTRKSQKPTSVDHALVTPVSKKSRSSKRTAEVLMDLSETGNDTTKESPLPAGSSSLATGRFHLEENNQSQDAASVASKQTYYTTAAAESLVQAASAENLTDVSAALDTARQMALALEALGAASTQDDSVVVKVVHVDDYQIAVAAAAEAEDDSSECNQFSPLPSSPPNNNKNKASKDHGLETSTTDGVTAVVVPTTVAVEEKIQAFCQQETGISAAASSVKWERVDTANAGDDDFVPLQDYSQLSPEKKAPYVPVVEPRVARANQLRLVRRRQQQRWRRRIVAAVSLLTACAAYYFYYYVMHHQSSSSSRSVSDRDSSDSSSSSMTQPIVRMEVPNVVVPMSRASNELSPVSTDATTASKAQVEDEEATIGSSNNNDTKPVPVPETLGLLPTVLEVPSVTLSPLAWLKSPPSQTAEKGRGGIENQRIHELLQAMLQ